MEDSSHIDAAWREHRAYLVNLAYQMLGDVGAAEDVVQEAFLRLARRDSTRIDDTRAWLTVVAGRLCLDQLRSARVRHERADTFGALEDVRSPALQPGERVTLDDEVRTALWEVLRRLSPGERVALVLHDVFQMPFDQIAAAVGRPVGTCRQLARRARAKIADASPKLAEVSAVEHRVVADSFITACANGDLQALTAVLDPSVWGAATFVGEDAPPARVDRGVSDVAISLLRYLGPGTTLVSDPWGRPLVLAFADRRLFAILVFTLRERRILTIEATVDASTADRRGRATRSGERGLPS